MANPAEFEQLVRNLMEKDNTVRGQGEAFYNNLKKNPDALAGSLLQLMTNQAANEHVRGMAVILLRPLLVSEKESVWAQLQPQTKATITQQLLQTLEQEQYASVRNKLCPVIANLGANLLEQNQWAELLPWLFQCSQSPNENHREAAHNVFSDLAGHLGNKIRPYFGVLKNVLSAGLTDPHSFKVRVAALAATCNFLQVLDEPQERQLFQQLTPTMLDTIGAALNVQKEEEAQNALGLFVELAEADPKFLAPNIASVVDVMFAIAKASNLDDATRHLAIEVLQTLSENRPAMMRKVPNFIPRFIELSIAFMLTLEDEPVAEWNASPDTDDTDITDFDIGEENLDRLAMAMGGKTMMPHFSVVVGVLLSNQDWRQRYSALMATSVIGEGCYKYLVQRLGDVMAVVLPTFRDPHPRVRWAACNCIGQMSTDFQPELQTQFHGQILPALMGVMDDVENPRVQAHAAAAIINFCEECDPELIAPYLDGLLSKLLALLQSGKIVIQEQAITAIAAIADCTTDTFDKYYDSIVPILKEILVSTEQHKEYRKLRGKAMECISLIAVAVGKERFRNDANTVLQIMINTQNQALDPDDPQISFMQHAWARLCKCLGSDFKECLPIVMPPLLATIKNKADVALMDADEEVEGKDGWEYINFGEDNKRLGINTSSMDDKANACNMIYNYADELKEDFFPYVDPIIKLLTPLLKFFYSDSVKTSSVSCMPPLLRSASEYFSKIGAMSGADPNYVRNLLKFILPSFYEAMEQENDVDILNIMIEAYVQCLDVAGENSLDAEQLKRAFEFFDDQIKEYLERRAQYLEEKADADLDDEANDAIDENLVRDEECLGYITDAVGRLIKFHKTNALPLLQNVVKVAVDFLQPNCSATEKQSGICIIDDTIEYTGPSLAVPLLQQVLHPIINFVSDEESIVRQAASYGMGIFAIAVPDLFRPVVTDVLNRLNAIITAPESRSEEHIGATETAISSIGRICDALPNDVNLALVLPVWLSYLPIEDDRVEAVDIYTKLCKFVENPATAQFILGNGFQQLPKVLQVFATALGTDIIDDELRNRIGNIVKQMQAQIPAEVLNAASAALTPELREKIGQALAK